MFPASKTRFKSGENLVKFSPSLIVLLFKELQQILKKKLRIS